MIKPFERSVKTIEKQVLIDAIESEVVRDAEVYCSVDCHVYFTQMGEDGLQVQFKVQFPGRLRVFGKTYVCDLYKRTPPSGTIFWSAYKGTIRDENGKVVG